MSFGNDWTSMIVHKVRQQELLNQAENERAAKAIKNEDEPRRRRIVRINNNPGR